MGLPKAIDFSNVSNEQIFNADTKQYRLLNRIPDDQWGNYCNKMLGKGISVTYDAELDCFTAKPQQLKVKESLMSENKKVILESGDKLRFKDKDNDIITGTIQWINEGESVELELPDGSVRTYSLDLLTKSVQKLYEVNHRFKKALTEDEKRALLYDQDEDEELPEESTTEEDEIESDSEDDEEPDFDSEADSLTSGIDEPEEEIVDNTMNALGSKRVESPGVVSMSDLETMLKKILGQNTQGQEKEQYPNGEAAAVQDQVPSLGQGPQANVLDTDFGEDKLNPSEDDETLESTYGHGSPLDSEFADIEDKVNTVKGKFEGDTFDVGSPGAPGAEEETPDLYNARNDGYGESEEYLTDDSDFERNAELSGGLGAYDTSEETGDVFEDGEDEIISPMVDTPEMLGAKPYNLPSVSGPMAEPTNPSPSVNKTVQCAGMPIQIVLTGVILTLNEVKTIAESVKKQGLTVKKIESNNPTELNIIVEANGRKYKVNYQDVDKYTNQSPFSIKHEKFQSLTEACERISSISKQNLVEKEKSNFKKFNNKDILTRSITKTTDSKLLKEFENKTNYISTWNVRAMGGINLKTGINEAYSNITTNSKVSNTLFKTKDGQFYLLKGNLNERSKVGTQKELVDLEGKKTYGTGKVVGIFENTTKGLGQIMYHTKRTSLPLLIWK